MNRFDSRKASVQSLLSVFRTKKSDAELAQDVQGPARQREVQTSTGTRPRRGADFSAAAAIGMIDRRRAGSCLCSSSSVSGSSDQPSDCSDDELTIPALLRPGKAAREGRNAAKRKKAQRRAKESLAAAAAAAAFSIAYGDERGQSSLSLRSISSSAPLMRDKRHRSMTRLRKRPLERESAREEPAAKLASEDPRPPPPPGGSNDCL